MRAPDYLQIGVLRSGGTRIWFVDGGYFNDWEQQSTMDFRCSPYRKSDRQGISLDLDSAKNPRDAPPFSNGRMFRLEASCQERE